MQYSQLSPDARDLHQFLLGQAAISGLSMAELAKIRMEAKSSSPTRVKAAKEIYQYETSKTN